MLVILDYEGGLPPIEQQPVDCSGDEGTLPEGEQPCFTPTPRAGGDAEAQAVTPAGTLARDAGRPWLRWRAA